MDAGTLIAVMVGVGFIVYAAFLIVQEKQYRRDYPGQDE